MNVYIGNTELDGLDIKHQAVFADRQSDLTVLAIDDEGDSVVRGIAKATIISIPFWSLLGLALYLLF